LSPSRRPPIAAQPDLSVSSAVAYHIPDMARLPTNVRNALIGWYLRRGHRKTGETEPFPYGDDRFGAPLRDDLSFLLLEKDRPIQSHFWGKNAKSASAGCRLRGGAGSTSIEPSNAKGVAAACPASMTRRFRREAAGLFLAFSSLVPKPSELADLSSGGLGFGRGLHAARRSRSVLNVPFQRSIRAWMLLHAARSARSSFSGEPATRPSSSSCPIGP
jgi:hypothetical protein